MMLLSRVAEDLYWMARYLERAEATARVVEQHTNLVADLPVGTDSRSFRPLLAVLGSAGSLDFPPEPVDELADELAVVHHLLADPDNSGSVVTSIGRARENLRSTRELVPRQLWESLSPLARRVGSDAVDAVGRVGRARFCEDVIATCQQTLGIIDSMMSHDQAHGFTRLGRHIERADMTTRVLDVRAGWLLATGLDEGPHADVRWLGVLEALGANQMYRRTMGVSIDADSVLRFLMQDPAFPRSVIRCLDEVEEVLLRLPRNAEAANSSRRARRLVGEPRVGAGHLLELQDHCDAIQIELNRMHAAFVEGFFGSEPVETEDEDDLDSATVEAAMPITGETVAAG